MSLRMSLFSDNSLFNCFCIFTIADLFSLSVLAILTRNTSFLLFSIKWFFSALGNISDNLWLLTHGYKVKGNFRYYHVNNINCKICSQDFDKTQEYLQLFARRVLNLSDWRGLLHIWRRRKIKTAALCIILRNHWRLELIVVHSSSHYNSIQ